MPVEIGGAPPGGGIGRIVMARPFDGADARVALLAPAGSRYEVELTLPERDPVLQVGLGYLQAQTKPGVEIRFRMLIGRGRRAPEAILDEVITTARDGAWADREISLAAWAGRKVRVTLTTESSSGPELAWGAWSSPEIFPRQADPAAWNVVLLVLDTLRADRLGSYGHTRPTSPNLDALAARSFRFETAISQSSWTRPSHRSMFTGLYPLSQGGLSSPPIAEVLWRNGFRTQAITGGAQLRYRFGFSRGFESHAIDKWVRGVERVVDTFESDRHRRHFVFLHSYEIHDPYVHTELAAGMDPGRVGARFTRRGLARLDGKPTDAERRYIEALYDSGIRYADAQVGRLFGELERRGLLERTLLIVTSDHGEEFWEHGHWGHGRTMYDEQSRVPLILHVPEAMRAALGLGEGARTIRQQVRLVDLYPTLLDLLGIPLTHTVHGRSLRPTLHGQRLPAVDAFSESIYWGKTEVKALRSERYKYFRGLAKNPARDPVEGWEALYDLAADPRELVDVRSSNERILVHMRSLVDRILAAGTTAGEDAVPEDMDAELKAELQALGYLD